jgi:hypothetical protein
MLGAFAEALASQSLTDAGEACGMGLPRSLLRLGHGGTNTGIPLDRARNPALCAGVSRVAPGIPGRLYGPRAETSRNRVPGGVPPGRGGAVGKR